MESLYRVLSLDIWKLKISRDLIICTNNKQNETEPVVNQKLEVEVLGVDNKYFQNTEKIAAESEQQSDMNASDSGSRS